MKALRPLALVALCALSACSNGRFTLYDHKVEIDRTNLDDAPMSAEAGRFAVDIEVLDFEGEERLFLSPVITAIQEHPGLEIKTLTVRGLQSYAAPTIQSDEKAPHELSLAIDTSYSGHWYNWPIGFPGMFPYVPVYLGYYYDCDLLFKSRLRRPDQDQFVDLGHEVQVAFRDLNPPRSAAWHIWPTNGVLGTQFVIGFFAAPFMWGYSGQYTTEKLAEELGENLGRHFAGRLYKALREDGAPDLGPAPPEKPKDTPDKPAPPPEKPTPPTEKPRGG